MSRKYFSTKDVMCVLPTGFGKPLIFHLVLMLLFAKGKIGGDFLLLLKRGIVLSEAVNAIVIVANPDRKNIYYEKVFRHNKESDTIQTILMPVAKGLLHTKIEYPLTIIYISLKLCGFAYKLFEYVLGSEQYFPVGSAQVPSNRLFAQYHAPQTSQMRGEILVQLCSRRSTICVDGLWQWVWVWIYQTFTKLYMLVLHTR